MVIGGGGGGMGTQKSQTWSLLSLLRVKDFYIDLSYIPSRLVTTKPNCFLSVRCSWVKVFTKYVLYVICFNSFMWPTTGTMPTSKPFRCQYLFEVSFCLLQMCLDGTQFWVCLQFKKQRQPVPHICQKVKGWTTKLGAYGTHERISQQCCFLWVATEQPVFFWEAYLSILQ